MSDTKQRLTAVEVTEVVKWLMIDPLLEGCTNGPVKEFGTKYRLVNNYNFYYVESRDCMVQLDKRSREQVQKRTRSQIDEKWGIEWKRSFNG